MEQIWRCGEGNKSFRLPSFLLPIPSLFPRRPPAQQRPSALTRYRLAATDYPADPRMVAFAAIPTPVLTSAAVAYGHYLSFMLCFGALLLERFLIRADPDRRTAITMVVVDVVYGIAALTLLLSGIARVLHFGQGSDFYTSNPLFWWKVGTYLAVGALSLYPTITYILWAIPLRKGELPKVSESLAGRLRLVLTVELAGFAVIPLMATLMARGVGLPAA